MVTKYLVCYCRNCWGEKDRVGMNKRWFGYLGFTLCMKPVMAYIDLSSAVEESFLIYDSFPDRNSVKEKYAEDLESLIADEQKAANYEKVMDDIWHHPDMAVIREIRFFHQEKDIIKAWGSVRFRYSGTDLTADYFEYDRKNKIVIFKGNVLLASTDATIQADRIEYDAETKTTRWYGAKSVLGPDITDSEFTESLYVDSWTGGSTSKEIEGSNCTVTSCGLYYPHYQLKVESMRIFPGDKIILKNVDVYINGTYRFTLPSLFLPLNGNTETSLPRFGYNEKLGYFVKSRWGFEVSNDSTDSVVFEFLVRYYSNFGWSLGNIITYKTPVASGSQHMYFMASDNYLKYTANHKQSFHIGEFGFKNQFHTKENEFRAYKPYQDFKIDYSKRIKSANVTASTTYRNFYNLKQGDVTTKVTHTDSASLPFNLSTDTEVIYEKNFREIPQQEDWNDASKDIDFRWRGSHSNSYFDTSLLYKKHLYLQGEDPNEKKSPSSSDRIPEVTFRTSWDKMLQRGKFKFTKAVPLDIELKYFSAYANSRLYNEYLSSKVVKLKSNKSLRSKYFTSGWNIEYEQHYHEKDTAHFNFKLAPKFEYHLGNKINFENSVHIRYDHGFSPFRSDLFNHQNYSNHELTVRPNDYIKASVKTRYDFKQAQENPHSFALGSLNWNMMLTPTEKTKLNLNSSFSPKDRKWGDINLNVRGEAGGCSFNWTNRWSDFKRKDEVLQKILRTSELSVSALSIMPFIITFSSKYDGIKKKFVDRKLILTYDMHCTELSFLYKKDFFGNKAEYEYGVFFALKGYPREFYGPSYSGDHPIEM